MPKKQRERKFIKVDCQPDFISLVERAAIQQGLSVSSYVRRAIKLQMDRDNKDYENNIGSPGVGRD